MNVNRDNSLRFTRRTLLAVGALGTALSAEAATLNVNAAGTNCAAADGSAAKPFCTIQAGVDKAASGDTVQVAAGTYNEEATVTDKALKILGAGDPSATAVNGFSTGFKMTGFTAPAKAVEIANFTISGASQAGVAFQSDNLNGWVHNCIFSANHVGVGTYNNAIAKVTNSVISASFYGLYADNNLSGSQINSDSNIIINNSTGAFADNIYYGHCIINSLNNIYFKNQRNRVGDGNWGTVASTNDLDNIDPKLVDPNGDFHLQAGSPAVDAGSPSPTSKDPDGSRADIGVYAGPYSSAFWPYSVAKPVVTGLTVSPAVVYVGGTLAVTGTGKAQ